MELFTITARDGDARAGSLRLTHGDAATPVLMPVASQATVKGVLAEQLADLGFELILANSFHLLVRPGLDVIEQAGGLHRFMGWDRPILTDSGGFQLFSLASLCKIVEEGVHFQSHVDGAVRFLSPEDAVRCQERLGSDIAMVLDEFPGYPCEKDAAERAAARTLRWAERCLAARTRGDQALFAILQGSVWPDLRASCAEKLAAMPFPGYAIGGLSVGEDRPTRAAVVKASAAALPEDRPRYAMGIGEPEDILPMVAAGVDLFDCVIPTRCGRNGRLYTFAGTVNIRNARFRGQAAPLEEGCPCPGCARTPAAYLHHLYSRDEMLGPILGTLHNLCFFQRFFARLRAAIAAGRFAAYAAEFLAGFARPAVEDETSA
ncbi:MAG TPA: tRNA guanosine(34) transglycosylase Tgt [Planctomycetota bacterium]|jgi:queuine tRNA-ribosyltransferase|nr:tRNA guanosine(34) transglycosylase Tgt [Planctomycetota bacterium]OQC19519.1 MAG: Queuine tRNA-ribosyltransferase [Planctomycetes bacterium ADurb.Bin069]HNR99889.1 tRNA guanosine(34) transglycosylase Tgt [Planctomycetota bacterium]HNU26405.1 tRNA guanosine(34) transglycosylase Tgt [Planctomycetota bacterium]HOE31245.1 tRNA guanosine(34) transglycosylase Tgt [Planctomycetota bacterium]